MSETRGSKNDCSRATVADGNGAETTRNQTAIGADWHLSAGFVAPRRIWIQMRRRIACGFVGELVLSSDHVNELF